ncbi:hypothetical protein TNCV_780471 [Trichonephila clavipes]|nr:hypothetical protein TNCV_780471 [Trichonephila clavipes]
MPGSSFTPTPLGHEDNLEVRHHPRANASHVKSPIMTEITSTKTDFGNASDHWHIALLSSTMANIVSESRHKGRKACVTVSGRNV